MQSNLAELPGMKLLETSDHLQYECEQKHFENTCFNIQSHYSYIWLLDIIVNHDFAKTKEDSFYNIKYLFLNTEFHHLITIHVKISSGDQLKSIAHLWRNASAIEQEVFQGFGINFSRQYEKYIDWGPDNFPMNKDFKRNSKNTKILKDQMKFSDTLYLKDNLKQNQYELSLNLKNNLVSNCRVASGRFYIGLEKIFEKNDIKTNYHILETYFPTKALTWSHLLSSSIEECHNIEISNRAKGIRMVLLELSRIQSHFHFISEVCLEFSMESLHSNCLIWTKRVQLLLMSYSGNEFGINCIRFGGVTKDVSQDWLSRTVNEISLLESSLLSCYKNLIQAASVKDALDFELINKTTASTWGVTGPALRAIGINLDYRKLKPFYFYDDVEFDVPIGVRGTGYDLLLVRVEEIFQSLKIVIQVLDNLPTGQIMDIEANSHIYYKDGTLDLDEDKYRDSVKNYLKIKDFQSTQLIEGSNGIMTMNIDYSSNTVNRFKIGTPSLMLKTLYEKVLKGEELNKARPLWTILDIDLKEVER